MTKKEIISFTRVIRKLLCFKVFVVIPSSVFFVTTVVMECVAFAGCNSRLLNAFCNVKAAPVKIHRWLFIRDILATVAMLFLAEICFRGSK